ncbi:hypothetical protein HanPSC8_Chr13g0552221 [Helianthus annuus]|nr:hypothetical protein HanPSC8_Chr13g0552221 [Helianthus annuus]
MSCFFTKQPQTFSLHTIFVCHRDASSISSPPTTTEPPSSSSHHTTQPSPTPIIANNHRNLDQAATAIEPPVNRHSHSTPT